MSRLSVVRNPEPAAAPTAAAELARAPSFPQLLVPGLQHHEIELISRVAASEATTERLRLEIAALETQRLALGIAAVGLPLVVWLVMRRKPKAAPAGLAAVPLTTAGQR